MCCDLVMGIKCESFLIVPDGCCGTVNLVIVPAKVNKVLNIIRIVIYPFINPGDDFIIVSFELKQFNKPHEISRVIDVFDQ